MMNYIGTPIFGLDDAGFAQHVLSIEASDISHEQITAAIEQNKLVLIRGTSFEDASTMFQEIVEHYDIRDSFDIQMQYVVHTISDRSSIEDIAVTVNKRGPYQVIQSHAEGDSTSQLDLFALYCSKNAASGGENILSLIDQSADHSRLRAKEKAIVGRDLTSSELSVLRASHLDAKDVLEECDEISRILVDSKRAAVVVRPVPIKASKSLINGEELVTYWDNVSVHDHAFHRYQFELLKHLGILTQGNGDDYRDYIHIEDDSYWSPVDTDSGDLEYTSQLFKCHILYKMAEGDILIFHNRAWTHSVNNYHPDEDRQLIAMYA